jgi:intracellular sulfur oxidation DsrE/DsrF family protein
MPMTAAARRLMVSSLSLLLLSCSATRHSVPAPTSARELGRYVLVLERAPDGQVTHSWKPVSDFDLTAHASLAAAHGTQGRIVQASFNRNCEEELTACENMCMASLRGRNWSHASKRAKREKCFEVCRPAYLDCCRLKELAEGQTVKFQAIDEAVAWVKQHHEELLQGAVIVIAGVAFVVAVVESGGLILLLVPAVALASAEVASEPRALAVKP